MELPKYHSYPSYLVTFDQKWPYIKPYLVEVYRQNYVKNTFENTTPGENTGKEVEEVTKRKENKDTDESDTDSEK